jgi:hypothetical protein
MAGYVTDSRILEHIAHASFAKNRAANASMLWTYSLSDFPDSDQTTTSYRTHGSWDTIDESTDPTNATSVIDFYRKLIDEDRTTRGGSDNGHTFVTESRRLSMSHPFVDTNPSDHNGWGRYVGPLIIQDFGDTAMQWPNTSVAETVHAQIGTGFIANTVPTNPIAGLAVALAELHREGLPGLPGAKAVQDVLKKHPGKNAGDEYLNWQFGYKPLANDVAKSLYAVNQASKLISDFKKNSGLKVRRRRTAPMQQSFGTSTFPSSLRGTPSYFGECFDGGTSTQVTVDELTQYYWSFSGAYSFLLPEENSSLFGQLKSYARDVNHLFGIELTPDVMWNLQPWSWLADWLWNLGDVIQNLSRFAEDSLTLKYGYVMCTTDAYRLYTKNPVTYYGSNVSSGPIWCKLSSTRKQRWQATPYGFGLNPGTFSERQWSILAALGLSKGNVKLR